MDARANKLVALCTRNIIWPKAALVVLALQHCLGWNTFQSNYSEVKLGCFEYITNLLTKTLFTTTHLDLKARALFSTVQDVELVRGNQCSPNPSGNTWWKEGRYRGQLASFSHTANSSLQWKQQALVLALPQSVRNTTIRQQCWRKQKEPFTRTASHTISSSCSVLYSKHTHQSVKVCGWRCAHICAQSVPRAYI